MQHPNKQLIALGIQQPWAELILRGIKTVEVRNVPVGMRTTIYLYSSQKLSSMSDAEVAIRQHGIDVTTLPTGQIVGTIDITDCQPCTEADAVKACVSWELMQGKYSWQLANPQRLAPLLKPRFLPYGMWFYPFKPRDPSNSDRRTR